MPDISMCFGRRCKKKDECYRHCARPDRPEQSYMDFEKWCNEKTGYPDMIPMQKGRKNG
ncbi:MAG: hypothetical protein LUH07_12625 [Lachnospiraceae bacterium]|nr:hypothetical protein [Lachnospiraceae bacterium]